ncbi:MAG: hypothetical protein GY718_18620 [Lentisphaerae bacterium]|nr:hypothetical protein [Lentisphaerota bacterium]
MQNSTAPELANDICGLPDKARYEARYEAKSHSYKGGSISCSMALI